jgi:hypothetical protein
MDINIIKEKWSKFYNFTLSYVNIIMIYQGALQRHPEITISVSIQAKNLILEIHPPILG